MPTARFARRNELHCGISMIGAEVKRTSVKNTLSLAIRIGHCLQMAKAELERPFEALLNLQPSTTYSRGRLIFRAQKRSADNKIAQVFRGELHRDAATSAEARSPTALTRTRVALPGR